MRGVAFLRGGEGEEHVAALRIGVLGEPAEQRAAVDLVGIHVAAMRLRAASCACRGSASGRHVRPRKRYPLPTTNISELTVTCVREL